VVRRLGTENPLYAAKDRKDISIETTPDFRRLLDERLDAIHVFGLTRERFRSEALLP